MKRNTRSNASTRSNGKPPPSQSSAPVPSRTRKRAPVDIALPHPLSWWRTRSADEFKKIDVVIARTVLTRTGIIGEPHWHLGAAGDPAVAIGVALRTQRRPNSIVALDVAMTAVLCVALEGDLTAALILSAALRCRADIGAHCGAISDSWLAYRPNKRFASSREPTPPSAVKTACHDEPRGPLQPRRL